jgi:transposase-like protein
MSGDSYQDTLFSPDDNPEDPRSNLITSTDVEGFPSEKNEYQVDPFAENVDAGKNTTLYQAHSYWTKVPPQGIIPYIEHFTDPDDLILDPFCGSGMTGVAALSANEPRKVVLNDLGAAATHIAYNYNTPIEADRVKLAVDKLESEITDFFDWLYTTECEKCGEERTIKNTIWSEIRECPHCESQFNLWNPAVIDEKVEERKNGFVRDEFDCPHCGTTVSKTEPEYRGIVATRIEYKCTPCFGRKYQLKELEEADYERRVPRRLQHSPTDTEGTDLRRQVLCGPCAPRTGKTVGRDPTVR